jgi:long-chain acyl-CoA synthetase
VAQLGGLLERSEVAVPPLAFPAWSLRSPARAVRAALQQLLVFPLHRLVCRPFVVEGREHLQGITPPLLLIANHTSHVDTPSILRALPWRVRHRVAVAAAADYFYRTRALGAAMSLLLNTFPFSRVGAVRSSLEYCGELVDGGWSILIYPEGTRSPSGAIQPFQSGIGLLASELNVPIVPIAVSGSYAILPKGRRWPRRGAVTVRIGVPISLCGGSDRIAAFGQLEEAVTTLLGR